MGARNETPTPNADNAPTKEKGYVGRDATTTGKRSNLAAASAQATAKKRDNQPAGSEDKGKGADKRKPSEEELTAFAQDLDTNMIEKARTSFFKGLVASVIVVIIVTVLIIASKYFLGIEA